MSVSLTTRETQLEEPVHPPLHAEPPTPPERRSTFGAGLFAGLIGGAVLSLVMTGLDAIQGRDIWVGAKFAGLPFLGPTAVLRPGFELVPVFIGVLSHFAVSAVWGILFAWLVDGRSKPATIAAGAAWGLVVWLVMYYMVMPILGAGEMASATPAGRAIALHVLFGLAVAFSYLPFQTPDEPPDDRLPQ